MTNDRLADECHGYDLDGYPVEFSLFDCSPQMAAKLARCNEIAKAQQNRTRHDQAMKLHRHTWDDLCILRRRVRQQYWYNGKIDYEYTLNT